MVFFFFLLIRQAPGPTLFPYTTLFRSHLDLDRVRPFGGNVERDLEPRLLRRRRAHREKDAALADEQHPGDRKSTRLNSSHGYISYAVFCLKKKNEHHTCPSAYPRDTQI